MKTISLTVFPVFVVVLVLSCGPTRNAGKTGSTTFIDISKARTEIEALGKQFSEDFGNRDSVALANHYASDGMLGSVKGKDNLISTWGKYIKYGIEHGTPNVKYISNSFASDDEYVVELGIYQYLDEGGNVKGHGKYVVVWKQEDGEWKIYRDNGL